MSKPDQIINRVQQSGLITIDIAEYYHKGEVVGYDIVQNLFQGLVLKEKDFRAFIADNDWSVYKNKNVYIHCSNEAIIPTWAYMLIMISIDEFAENVVVGSRESMQQHLSDLAIQKINFDHFLDTRVVIKGCSDHEIPAYAYGKLSQKLKPIVKSLMFGEPCSTVPLYKRKKV